MSIGVKPWAVQGILIISIMEAWEKIAYALQTWNLSYKHEICQAIDESIKEVFYLSTDIL